MKTLYEQYIDFYSSSKPFYKTFSTNLKEKPNYFYFLYFFLMDNEKEEYKKKDFYKSYIDWYSSLPKESEDYEKIQLIYHSALIMRNEKEDLFDEIISCIKYSINNPFFFYELGVDREEWINNIIWQNREKNELHPYIKNNLKHNELGYAIIKYLIRNWFLPRYDFESIRKLIRAVPVKSDSIFARMLSWALITNNPFKAFTGSFKNKYPGWFNLLLSIVPLSITLLYLFYDKIKIGLINFQYFPMGFTEGIFNINLKENEHIIKPIYNTPEIFFEILFFLFILTYLIKAFLNPLEKYLIFHRLLIGIVLGYFAAFGGSSYWSMAMLSFSTNSLLAIVSANIGLTFIVFMYIKYEVRKSISEYDFHYAENSTDENDGSKKKKKNTYENKIRVRYLEFFRKAVWSSFFIGLIMLDVFFIVYLRNVESEFGAEGFSLLSHRFHTGLIGIIDPVLLLFFFPLALITGVVIKFILDEKPISDPIK